MANDIPCGTAIIATSALVVVGTQGTNLSPAVTGIGRVATGAVLLLAPVSEVRSGAGKRPRENSRVGQSTNTSRNLDGQPRLITTRDELPNLRRRFDDVSDVPRRRLDDNMNA